jgi:hypothetical protein
MKFPITFIGEFTFSNVIIAIKAKLPDKHSTAGIAGRVDGLGCSMNQAEGVFFWVDGSGSASISLDPKRNQTLISQSKVSCFSTQLIPFQVLMFLPINGSRLKLNFLTTMSLLGSMELICLEAKFCFLILDLDSQR